MKQVTTIKRHAKTTTPEPVQPEAPEKPEVPETPLEMPEFPNIDILEDSMTFKMERYVPKSTERQVPFLLVVAICFALIIGIIILCYWENTEAHTPLAAYTVPMTVVQNANHSVHTVVTITTEKLADPYIDIYRNDEKVKTDIVEINAHKFEAVLEQSGEYTIVALGANEKAVYYAVRHITVNVQGDYAGLTEAVANYINGINTPNKAQLVAALRDAYIYAAKNAKGKSVDAVINALQIKNKEILGFDQPQPTTDEHIWHTLLGAHGIIDTYLTSNNIVIVNNNISDIFMAIAEGLK